MIARNDGANGNGSGNGRTNGSGRIQRCVQFERAQLADLQELAWASNVPVDALVREAVDRYRRAPEGPSTADPQVRRAARAPARPPRP